MSVAVPVIPGLDVDAGPVVRGAGLPHAPSAAHLVELATFHSAISRSVVVAYVGHRPDSHAVGDPTTRWAPTGRPHEMAETQ
jgi:hypothetical protein